MKYIAPKEKVTQKKKKKEPKILHIVGKWQAETECKSVSCVQILRFDTDTTRPPHTWARPIQP